MTYHIQRLQKKNYIKKYFKYYYSLIYHNISYKLYIGFNYKLLTQV